MTVARVVVDPAICQTTGVCESIDPDRFQVGADGLLGIRDARVAASELAVVEEAIKACPTGALRREPVREE